MNTLNRQIALTMRVTSNSNESPKTGVMENVAKNLNGFSYTNNIDGTVTAVKGVEKYTIDALAFVAIAAVKTPLRPEWYETGQLQDKVVLPAIGHRPFEFKSIAVQNIVIGGHYLTAEQYRRNCYALMQLPPIDITAVQDKISAIKAQDTKEHILAALAEVNNLLHPVLPDLSDAQQTTYDRLVELEKPLNDVKNLLEPLGISKVQFTSEKSVKGRLDPARLPEILTFIPSKPDWIFTNEIVDGGVFLTVTIK